MATIKLRANYPGGLSIADIDANFTNLNTDKIEASVTTLSSLVSIGTITTGVWNAGTVTSNGLIKGTRFESTIATGNAPLTVASTTMVTNLNANTVNGYTSAQLLDSANLTGTLSSTVLGNSTVYIGTTGIALNRASAALTLNGVTAEKALLTTATISAGSDGDLVTATMATNDYFRIRVGGAADSGYAEIAIADNGTEPIYVRQYTTTTNTWDTLLRTLTLLDGSGNTSIPGNLTVTGSLFINGTTTNVHSTVVTLDDPVLILGGDTALVETDKDRGIEMKYNGTTITIISYTGNGTTTVTGSVSSTTGWAAGDIITISGATSSASLNGTWKIATVGAGTFTFVTSASVAVGTYGANNGTTVKVKNAFMGFQQSTGKFTLLTQVNNTSETFTGTKGVLDANVDWSNIQNYSTMTGVSSISGLTSLSGTNITASGFSSLSATTDLTISGADVTASTSTGGSVLIKGGSSSGTTTAQGGSVDVRAGSATGANGTRNGGNLSLDAGYGATALGKIYIGYYTTIGFTGTSEIYVGGSSTSLYLKPTSDNSTSATHYVNFTSSTNLYKTSTNLTFNPSTGTLAATDFNSTSDIKFKTNVATAKNATSIVTSLRGVEFNWISSGKKSSGVIAQELETTLPHLVNTDENGDKSVNYNGIIAYLIETVKELNERINQLEKR
jgi:hypothetical protein